jgi:2-keto-3-deoxy-L-rhamnonate aldolase RhmA
MPDTTLLANPLKDMMKAGKVALGMNVRLARSGEIARIAKSSGHDFVFIDGQHAIFNPETVTHIAQTALACGITPIARVKSVDDQDVQVLLDNGVMGIVYPDVNTAAEARRGVARAKFPPLGKRSAAGGYSMFDYRPVPVSRTVPLLDDATLVVCMIETPEGVKNVEEIARVDGVDVVHIGANDLLTAMGKPGAFGDPEGAKAIDRVISATAAAGKIPGMGGDRDIPRQLEYIRRGARFITTNSEIAFIMAEATRVTTELRKALGEK